MSQPLPFKVPKGYFRSQEKYWLNYKRNAMKRTFPKWNIFIKTYAWAAVFVALFAFGIALYYYLHQKHLEEKSIEAIYSIYFEEIGLEEGEYVHEFE